MMLSLHYLCFRFLEACVGDISEILQDEVGFLRMTGEARVRMSSAHHS